MKRLASAVVLAAVPVFLATAMLPAPVHAQTNLSSVLNFTGGPIYTPFTVSTGGTFDLFSSNRSAGNDPTIWLFTGGFYGPNVTGAMVYGNDDWAGNCCGNAGMPVANLPGAYAGMGTFDSGFRVNLGAGVYTAVSGEYEFSEAQARAGTGVTTDGNHTLNIRSASGVAAYGITVPEPGSMLLIVSGFLAMVAIRRRRENTA